jgi:8-oxo-dGTP pyrophosphatase MutT (NUDIX family)
MVVSIPRPPASRPGEPAPWAGRAYRPIDAELVRTRLGSFEPDRDEARESEPGARLSGVLIPLLAADDHGGLAVVLGKRSAELPSHRGDLSFPGGRHQKEDPDLRATALREADEEMGIDPRKVEVVGELDHLGTVASNFLIAPFVGLIEGDGSDLVPQVGEVDRILLVPLRRLLEPGVFRQELWSGVGGRTAVRGPDDPTAQWSGPEAMTERPVNFFTVDEWDVVWGATATILHQLLDVLTRE